MYKSTKYNWGLESGGYGSASNRIHEAVKTLRDLPRISDTTPDFTRIPSSRHQAPATGKAASLFVSPLLPVTSIRLRLQQDFDPDFRPGEFSVTRIDISETAKPWTQTTPERPGGF